MFTRPRQILFTDSRSKNTPDLIPSLPLQTARKLGPPQTLEIKPRMQNIYTSNTVIGILNRISRKTEIETPD